MAGGPLLKFGNVSVRLKVVPRETERSPIGRNGRNPTIPAHAKPGKHKPDSNASTLSARCMPEEPTPDCYSGGEIGVFDEFLVEAEWVSEAGEYSSVEIYGAVEWTTVERIEVVGRRNVCIDWICSYPANTEILDFTLRGELGGANAGFIDWIIEKLFPKATAPLNVCSDSRLAAYRDVTKDTPLEIRPAKAAGVFLTTHPNTTRTGQIDVDVTWSDGTREIYSMEAASPAGTAQLKETKNVGTGVAGC